MTRSQPSPNAAVSVAIAVTTRNRPGMLTDCLASFSAMTIPQALSVQFLIVENTPKLTVGPIVDAFAATLPGSAGASLLHQPELGIPFARNKALDAATAQGCDWLIFVDDDETVAPDWLAQLVEGALSKGYDLAVGPVTPLPPQGPLSLSETRIYNHYLADAERRSARMAKGGKGTGDLATNNWIGRVAALQAAGLRFDEAMRHTGGTDTDLSRRAQKAGLRLGWIPEAMVYEVVPRDRMTFGYIFRRSRSQTLAKYHIRYGKTGRRVTLRLLGTIVQKALVGGVRILFGYLTGSSLGTPLGTTLRAKGMRTLGVSVGYLQGLLGQRSTLYQTTQGH